MQHVDLMGSNEETAISVWLRRTKEGVTLQVKVSPEVEDFFRHWSGGVTEDTRHYGRHWRVKESNSPLMVWALTAGGDPVRGLNYTIWTPGNPILGRTIDPDGEMGDPRPLTNISFIRLVGASEGEGVKFGCEMLVSKGQIEDLATRISHAVGTFYNDYIRPVSYNVTLVQPIVRVQEGRHG